MPTQLNRRAMLRAAACGPWILSSHARAAAPRPNFIFMLTDDQSYATMSITGSSFMRTPNLDRIGREGALFTNAFVAMSLCAPSRACFLSGMYPHRNTIINNQTRWNQEIPTLQRLLHDAGYTTAHIGKWHMDGDDRVQPGYDYWAAQINQGQYENPRKNINGVWTDLKGYDTTIVTDQAVAFMNDARRRNSPFCLWIGYKACHGPFTPAPGHENDFANVEFKPPASFFIGDEGKPRRVRNKSQNPARQSARNARKAARKAAAGDPPASLERWAERERNQHRCLMGVDDSAARILGFLDENKLAEDTILVFAGDNGFFHGEHGLHGKMEAYEESLRIPMMVRYPRLVKAGQKVGAFVANVDLAPTILDLCGLKPQPSMQGRSWKPLVTGGKPSQPLARRVRLFHSQYRSRPPNRQGAKDRSL
ncbi:MAG: sulfatase-like hydrolase/transferase [Bryobacteraceae bacterium]|nr:sulfatase-like hydrolase/transferase [Bryobacteraceae bacterium]